MSGTSASPAASPAFAGRRARAGVGNADRRAGFTLFELLLVVAISAILAGLAVPALMRSLRGEQLRAAARAIVASHRLARATAALQAADVELRLDPERRHVLVVRRTPAKEAAEAKVPGDAAATTSPTEDEPARRERVEARREWSATVKLVRVEIGDDLFEGAAPRTIPYRPGGASPPFAIHLEDERADRAVIRVDPVTGRARVDYEGSR